MKINVSIFYKSYYLKVKLKDEHTQCNVYTTQYKYVKKMRKQTYKNKLV